jgi:hypothetical protein
MSTLTVQLSGIDVTCDYYTTPYRAATHWEPEEPRALVIESAEISGEEFSEWLNEKAIAELSERIEKSLKDFDDNLPDPEDYDSPGEYRYACQRLRNVA